MKLKRHLWLIAILTLTILASSLVLAQPVSAEAVEEPWPMYNQNPAHTSVGVGTAPKYLKVKWVYKTGGIIQGSANIAGGNIYFGSTDKNLYCVNAETGALVWKYTTKYLIRSSPAIVNGKVYTGCDDGNFYCLDAKTGTVIWTTPSDGGLIQGITSYTPTEIRSSPCVVGGLVYVGSLDTKVYCLDATTGAIKWKYATTDSVCSTPAVVDGKVYVGSRDSIFYCLSATDGSLVWKWNTVRPGETIESGLGGYGYLQIMGSATVLEDLNMVVIFSNAGSRYWALDMDTGKPVWLFWPRRQRYNYQNPKPLDVKVGGLNPKDQPGQDPLDCRTSALHWGTAAYYGGSLYLDEDYFMQRLNAATGERYWAPYSGMLLPTYTDYIGNDTQAGEHIFNPELSIGYITCSSTAYADGKVYTGGGERSVYCNDAITGTRYSWYETGGFITSSPSIGYGKLYIGSFDWGMYCFEDGGIVRHFSSARTVTSITATLSSTEVVLGTPLTIKGAMSPNPPDDPVYGGPCVTAFFTRPDGTKWQESGECKDSATGWYHGDPNYELSYVPDMVGTWTVKVMLVPEPYAPYVDSVTATMTFNVVAASLAASSLVSSQWVAPNEIIAGVADIYIYVAVIAIVAIVILVAVWQTRRKETKK